MLLFIYAQQNKSTCNFDVSIHLMLLFILKPNRFQIFFFPFQYISCYSLSSWRIKLAKENTTFQYISCYSLSLAFLTFLSYQLPFQYISCYSLSISPIWSEMCSSVSIHLMLLFITSGNNPASAWTTFQYISCYSLSPVGQRSGCCQQTFQYISCYSLSLVFPIFSLLTFFIISQNTRVCNIFPKQHRLFESFHRSTPKPYIFTTFHIFL